MTRSLQRVDRVRGSLVGAVVGDVLGRPWEGVEPSDIPAGARLEATPGVGPYTDDTAMMLALARAILDAGEVHPDGIRAEFFQAWSRDPDRGYGPGTQRLMALWEQGLSTHEALALVGDRPTNGGAMRVAPVGIAYMRSLRLTDQFARISAAVTHSNDEAQDGAAVQALAVAACLRGRAPLTISAYARTDAFRRALRVATNLPIKYRFCPNQLAAILGNGFLARESVVLALACAEYGRTFDETLELAIRAGGDADTTGAMTGAIAGARFGLLAIPDRWQQLVDQAVGGLSRIVETADGLLRLGVHDPCRR